MADLGPAWFGCLDDGEPLGAQRQVVLAQGVKVQDASVEVHGAGEAVGPAADAVVEFALAGLGVDAHRQDGEDQQA